MTDLRLLITDEPAARAADWMATRGFLTAINRNGINRVRDVSILRKASFEETTDVLFGAAVFS